VASHACRLTYPREPDACSVIRDVTASRSDYTVPSPRARCSRGNTTLFTGRTIPLPGFRVEFAQRPNSVYVRQSSPYIYIYNVRSPVYLCDTRFSGFFEWISRIVCGGVINTTCQYSARARPRVISLLLFIVIYTYIVHACVDISTFRKSRTSSRYINSLRTTRRLVSRVNLPETNRDVLSYGYRLVFPAPSPDHDDDNSGFSPFTTAYNRYVHSLRVYHGVWRDGRPSFARDIATNSPCHGAYVGTVYSPSR